jgi:hypothetical protein
MGLYYRIEGPDNNVFLAPSCAVVFRQTSELEFMWIDNASIPMKTKKVSVLSEAELECYGIAAILKPDWIQPRKQRSV